MATAVAAEREVYEMHYRRAPSTAGLEHIEHPLLREAIAIGSHAQIAGFVSGLSIAEDALLLLAKNAAERPERYSRFSAHDFRLLAAGAVNEAMAPDKVQQRVDKLNALLRSRHAATH